MASKDAQTADRPFAAVVGTGGDLICAGGCLGCRFVNQAWGVR